MAVLHGKDASIALASGSSTAFTNEGLTANAGRTIYTVTDSTKRYWDPATTATVQRSTDGGATWGTATGATVTYVGGYVTFASAQPVGTQVRASGAYFTSTTVGQAHEWSLDLGLDTAEVSAFGDTWKQFTPTLRGASASVSSWWLDATFLGLLTSKVVLSLDTGAGRYEGFAWLTSDGVKTAVDAVTSDDLSFTFEGQVFYAAA